MVGNEKSNGNRCKDYPLLHCPQKCRGERKAGTGVSERCHRTLARKPRAADGDAKDQAAAEADASARFYDTLRGSAVLNPRETYTAPREVLSDRVVHGEPPVSDNGPEVVDGES